MTDSPVFSIGIDLGTTNSAVACAAVPADGPPAAIDVLQIPQLVAPGETAALALLPSFLYIVGEFDFPAGSLGLPWTTADRQLDLAPPPARR